MVNRFLLSSGLAWLWPLLCITICHAQPAGPPPPLRQEITALSGTPSAEQTALIDNYARYWAGQLNAATPDEVVRARRELLRPANDISATDIFRTAYARTLVPLLDPIISQPAGERQFAAVNAMLVMAALRGDQALQSVLRRINMADEKRPGIRMLAAQAVRNIATGSGITPQRVTAAVRDLGRAAAAETDPVALRDQFAALAAIPTDESRDERIRTLNTVVDRMRGDSGPSALMPAAYAAVVQLRDEFFDSKDPARQRAFGSSLGPALGKMLTLAQSHWEGVQSDPRAKDLYGKVIQAVEAALRRVDGLVRGTASPSSNLKTSWDSGDRTRFETDLTGWQTILQASPYKR